MCPEITATIPPTSGHKNHETMPATSETTAALFVGGLYMSRGEAYWTEFWG